MAPDTLERWSHRSLATAVIFGLLGFLYPLIEILRKIQTWEIQWNPPQVADLLQCLVCALIAVAAALKLDIPTFLRGFTKQE